MADLNESLKDKAIEDEKLEDVSGGGSFSDRSKTFVFKKDFEVYEYLNLFPYNYSRADIDAALAKFNVKLSSDAFDELERELFVKVEYSGLTTSWSITDMHLI